MRNVLVDKYLEFKHKILVSYAETLYKVYEIKDEQLWSNEKELKIITDNILKIYINKYYLRNKDELNELNVTNMDEKDFRKSLSLAVIADYYGNRYLSLKDNYKKSIYNLTLIIYIVTNIDKDISFYNKGVQIKTIVDRINELFGDVLENHHVSKNPFLLDVLANKIKEAERKELRFFEALKDSESYNTFLKYDNNVYYVNYNRDFNNLHKYDLNDIKKVYSKYKIKESLYKISYELTCMTLLKAFSNNCSIPQLLIPITSKYIALKSNILEINSIFENEFLKKYVSFSIPYSDYIANYDKFSVLIENGFNIVIYINEFNEISDYSKIKFNYKLYITSKFVINNPKFESFIEKSEKNYKIIDSDLTHLNEDELINVCLKGEN